MKISLTALSSFLGPFLDLVPLARLAGSAPQVQSLQTHQPHQSLGSLAVDHLTTVFQLVAQPSAAIEQICK